MSKIQEILEAIKKSDVKNTERRIEKEIVDNIDGNEVAYINSFLKKGEKIDGKNIKTLDALVQQYRRKIGTSKAKNDPNLMMLAPILAAMKAELEK